MQSNKPNEERSLKMDELNEESSIESTLHSNEGCLEIDDSDLDSTCGDRSLGRTGTWDADSTESPLLSGDENDELDTLSDTLNDNEGDDADIKESGQAGEGLAYVNTLLTSFSSTPLARITEHTRENSTSCRTNSIQADVESPSFRLLSPSGRMNSRLSQSGILRSPRSICRPDTPKNKPHMTIIEWDEGMLDGEEFKTLSISDEKYELQTDPA